MSVSGTGGSKDPFDSYDQNTSQKNSLKGQEAEGTEEAMPLEQVESSLEDVEKEKASSKGEKENLSPALMERISSSDYQSSKIRKSTELALKSQEGGSVEEGEGSEAKRRKTKEDSTPPNEVQKAKVEATPAPKAPSRSELLQKWHRLVPLGEGQFEWTPLRVDDTSSRGIEAEKQRTSFAASLQNVALKSGNIEANFENITTSEFLALPFKGPELTALLKGAKFLDQSLIDLRNSNTQKALKNVYPGAKFSAAPAWPPSVQGWLKGASIGEKTRLSGIGGDLHYQFTGGNFQGEASLLSQIVQTALNGASNIFEFVERYEYIRTAVEEQKREGKSDYSKNWGAFAGEVEKSLAIESGEAISAGLVGKLPLKDHLDVRRLQFPSGTAIAYHTHKHFDTELMTKSKTINDPQIKKEVETILSEDRGKDFIDSASKYLEVARLIVAKGARDENFISFDQSGRRQYRFSLPCGSDTLAVIVKVDKDNQAFIATMY